MKILLDESKNFYKANLHCHTTRSDGRATPEVVKEEYKKRGYSAVAFTEHDHLINSAYLTDEDFVAITACELKVIGPKVDKYSPKPSGKLAHLNFYAKDPACDMTPCYHEKYDWYRFEDLRHLVKYDEPYERVYSHEGINDMIRRGHEQGFLVSLNHPNWSLQTAEDYLGYEDLDFIEVYNNDCRRILGHHTDEAAYNDMMKAGMMVKCTATDDNHNAGGFEGAKSDSFGGWVMIAADRLGYAELMDALERGDFYASSGPEIKSIVIDDGGILRIKCSEAERIVLITQGRRNAVVCSTDGEPIKEGAFKFYEQDVRFRIRVEDGRGNAAYSQIYELPADCPRTMPKA